MLWKAFCFVAVAVACFVNANKGSLDISFLSHFKVCINKLEKLMTPS